MPLQPELLDDLVASFRERMLDAVARMDEARTPEAFCDAERGVHSLALELAAEVTRAVLQQASDKSSRRREALARVRKRAASKGLQMKTERTRETPIRTLSGQTIKVRTPYARALPRGGGRGTRRGSMGTGVYPVLDELGIVDRSTPALRLRVSHAVCEANSVSSARELLSVSGLTIDHKAALRLTYDVCDDALRARRQGMRAQKQGADDGPFAGRRVVAAVDGGRVLIRKRLSGRPKKGGRRRFETEWREPKVLTIYVLDPDGSRDRSVASVIDGTLGDADAVFALLEYHLRRMGAHRATELTLIGDAAPWIWNRAEGLRSRLGIPTERFAEIVDYFHAVERLCELSKAHIHDGEETRLQWLREQKRRLKLGRIEELEAVFRVIGKREPEAMAIEGAYWSRNRERLRYGAFRARKLPIGSGAVESAVRRVVNLRMKGASIAWTEEHAEGILHLRAHAKSGRWLDLERNVLRTTGWRPTSRIFRAPPPT